MGLFADLMRPLFDTFFGFFFLHFRPNAVYPFMATSAALSTFSCAFDWVVFWFPVSHSLYPSKNETWFCHPTGAHAAPQPPAAAPHLLRPSNWSPSATKNTSRESMIRDQGKKYKIFFNSQISLKAILHITEKDNNETKGNFYPCYLAYWLYFGRQMYSGEDALTFLFNMVDLKKRTFCTKIV